MTLDAQKEEPPRVGVVAMAKGTGKTFRKSRESHFRLTDH